MTSEREPPRLRTLEGELPRELLLALGEADVDAVPPAELAALRRRFAHARSEGESEMGRSSFVPRRRAVRGRVASLVLVFSFGAAAGVLVSGGVFVVTQRRGVESARPGASSPEPRGTPAARPVPPPVPSGALEAALDVAPAPPPLREHAQSPARRSSAEPPADPPSSPASPNSPKSSRGAEREEHALLERAQSSLATNPGLALALTSDHERKFPEGALVQEREVVAVDALLRLGRRAEAARRAVRFRRQFPSSVHGHRLDVLLASSEESASDHN